MRIMAIATVDHKMGSVGKRISAIAVVGGCAHVAAMRTLLMILGIAAVLMGLLWIGQGLGIVQWPASSFMIDQRPWVARGAVLAVVGAALILASRARR
jgi:hypothetical protein